MWTGRLAWRGMAIPIILRATDASASSATGPAHFHPMSQHSSTRPSIPNTTKCDHLDFIRKMR